MNRSELNDQLAILNLEGLLLGYRETPEDKVLDQQEAYAADGEELAFAIHRVPDPAPSVTGWYCEGNQEGIAPGQPDNVGCDEPAKWAVDSEDDYGPKMYCSACVVELLGPNGNFKVIAGEVTIER